MTAPRRYGALIARLTRNMFPRTADFGALLGEQAQVAADALAALAEYARTGEPEAAERVAAIEKRGDRLRERNLDTLNRSFTTMFDRDLTAVAIRHIDDVANYAKTTVREMGMLAMEPDPTVLAIAEILSGGGRSTSEPPPPGSVATRNWSRSTSRACTRPSGGLRRSTARPSPSSSGRTPARDGARAGTRSRSCSTPCGGARSTGTSRTRPDPHAGRGVAWYRSRQATEAFTEGRREVDLPLGQDFEVGVEITWRARDRTDRSVERLAATGDVADRTAVTVGSEPHGVEVLVIGATPVGLPAGGPQEP